MLNRTTWLLMTDAYGTGKYSGRRLGLVIFIVLTVAILRGALKIYTARPVHPINHIPSCHYYALELPWALVQS
jgi:hypothetical protein